MKSTLWLDGYAPPTARLFYGTSAFIVYSPLNPHWFHFKLLIAIDLEYIYGVE